MFKKFFKNNNSASSAPIDDESSAVRTMTPSSPGFNPPKFSFNKKKLAGSISINEHANSIANDSETMAVDAEVSLFEEYPDDLFHSLIDESPVEREALAPIKEEPVYCQIQGNHQSGSKILPDKHTNTNQSGSNNEKNEYYPLPSNFSQPHKQPDLHEPKPIAALNGNRLIFQLTAFATSLETFKFSLQQRQNSLDLAILGLDEKLGKQAVFLFYLISLAEIHNFNLDMLI
jgi:hypothetical protein